MLEWIRHLLALPRPTLPSEFYLPPDCDIHQRADHYRIRHTRESRFSGLFPGSGLHDLGSYPRYLAFETHQEQMRLSTTLGEWLAKLGELSPGDYRLAWRDEAKWSTAGERADRAVVLEDPRRLLVTRALEKVQTVQEGAAARPGVDPDEAGRHLTWLAGERIVPARRGGKTLPGPSHPGGRGGSRRAGSAARRRRRFPREISCALAPPLVSLLISVTLRCPLARGAADVQPATQGAPGAIGLVHHRPRVAVDPAAGTLARN